ncbi:hypothetical protein RhiirC2_796941, partial [Rhizophagus irregularis]
YIDRGLPGQNFNLRLIGSAKKGRVKRILQFSLNNGWNELEHTRVQPPTSLGLEVRPRILSIEKNNNLLRISRSLDILQKYADLVLQKYSNYLRDWTIEEKDSENFIYFNRKAPLGCPLCKHIHDKDQRWFGRVCASSERFIQNNKNLSPAVLLRKLKSPGFPKAFVKMPSWVKERYVRLLPNEGDIYVGSPWETGKTYVLEHLTIPDDVNANTRPFGWTIYRKLYKLVQDARRIIVMDNDLTDLNIEWIKALRKNMPFSIIHNTYQPQKDVQGILRALKTDFPELQIKEYHGKSDPVEKAHDFSNVEESWKDVDLVAYTSTLKIGVSCTNPKFDWRMVDFLQKAGMVISIMESKLKSKENTLSQVVKSKCLTVKAEEISDISNANILDQCYEILPETLTEDFISKYGNFNHMKWFRAYRQLRDAGTNNEVAVEAITRKDYREDKLIVATRAEKHRICLELLKTCTPARDVDDRARYKADDVKTRLNSPESISYLQDLVPKMARVFDNTDALRRIKKSELKTVRAKLGLLNSALYATYGLKFKAIDKNLKYYHLVGSFDSKDAPELPSYQTGKEIYWENGNDTRYGYSKLSSDELLTKNKQTKIISSLNVNTMPIAEDI